MVNTSTIVKIRELLARDRDLRERFERFEPVLESEIHEARDQLVEVCRQSLDEVLEFTTKLMGQVSKLEEQCRNLQHMLWKKERAEDPIAKHRQFFGDIDFKSLLVEAKMKNRW